MASVISWKARFASSNQRRGVTPFVLLQRSGNNSLKSLNAVERGSWE